MKLCLKYRLLAFCCLIVAFKGYGQVEFSGLAGSAFSYSFLGYHPDSVGNAPVKSGLNGGYAFTLEASLPMQYGFRLKAGVRMMHKNYGFEQAYNLSGSTFKNYWMLHGFSLETPVHLTYLAVDKRFQITVGTGMAVVKDWMKPGYSSISSSGTGASGSFTSSFSNNIITSRFQPEKNSVSIAGEFIAEIAHSTFPRLNLVFLWHQDLLKQFGRLTYENQYNPVAIVNQQGNLDSEGSFRIERPGYIMVQLKYTFAGKPKEKETDGEITDIEEDGNE